MSHGGKTNSLWMKTVESMSRSKLLSNTESNVCVVGTGIAGLTTAYLLLKEGKSVVVLDDGVIGGGETERTTAHLSNALDDYYFKLEQLHGKKGAFLAAQSHTAAIDCIERVIHEENIRCGFERVDGYLFTASNKDLEILENEMEASHRAGLFEVEALERAPLSLFDSGPCLRFPQQAQFHPLQYLYGLAKLIENMGGRIFCETHVEKISNEDPIQVVSSEGHIVFSEDVVVATNTPFNDFVVMHTKQAAYRSYVISARIPKGIITKALYWDTADPYHYVRIQDGPFDQNYDLLIVGGEDHKTGQADDAEIRFGKLETWARKRFPLMENVEDRWSGQIMEPMDGLAFIGRNPMDNSHVYIATGDSGHGLTHGTIAGMLLTDLIVGRENEWESLYDPSRITLKAAGEFARENLNVATQYAGWLKKGDVQSVSEIAEDEGAVIRKGIHEIAVYRDQLGNTHEFSAACPHLGCVLKWNHTEKTWDCPCHGSRFDKEGCVLNGPAMSDMKSLDQPVEVETRE